MGTRDTILEAADRLFGDVGFEAASTREIAEHSGINKALIHYHFATKEALLASVLDRYYDRLQAVLIGAVGTSGPLEGRLERLIDAYVDFLGQNRGFCRIVQREACGGKNAGFIRDRMMPLFSLGRELIVGGFPATAAGALAAEHLMVSVYGMIITYFTYADVLEPLIGSDPYSAANLAARKSHLLRVIGVLLRAVESEAQAHD